MKTLSRKAQVLSGLLLYRVSAGSVDSGYFGSILQQMFSDKIKNIHIDLGTLNNSFAKVDLDKLVKKKRFKRKSEDFQNAYREYIKQTKPSPAEKITIGEIVIRWADITNQNRGEFMIRVCPKIKVLVTEQNDIAVIQNPEYDQTGAAFKFVQDLFLLLLSETPSDKKAALVEHLKEMILNAGPLSGIELPDEITSLSCKMVIGDTVTKLNDAFSANSQTKLFLQKPIFGAVVEIMAKKYGWESGVPDDNDAKLRNELEEKGLFFNERSQSRALKELARRNVLLTIDSALDGTLINDLAKIILDRRTTQQNDTQSEYVYEPTSSEDETEIKNRIRELLFKRRNENGKSDRNH